MIRSHSEFTNGNFTLVSAAHVQGCQEHRVSGGALPRPVPMVDETADLALGERIRHLRKARGKSLKDLSEATGLSISFVSQIERGLSSASVRTLARLADALDVGIGELFGPAE